MNKRLSVYIKYNNLFYLIYWIKRNNNNITGWIDGGIIPSILAKEEHLKDIHFTYPKDGNLHYTITLNDSKERFFTTINRNCKNNLGITNCLDGTKLNIINWLLPTNNQPSFNEFQSSNKLYQFPLCSLPFLKNKSNFLNKFNSSKIKGKEIIVIEVNDNSNITLSISAILLGFRNNLGEVLDKLNIYKLDKSAYPLMILFANTHNHD
jgi:hypothetical protein